MECYNPFVLPSIENTLQKLGWFERTRRMVVGVSGGPDSLALMDALYRLGYPICVAHFNHHLRPEASQEAAFVARQAAARGLDFALGEQDVRAYARRTRQSIEEAARSLRYTFLFAQAHNMQAQAVAVAHNADDQVETVLMHFLRGAGTAGLKGMRFSSILPEWDPQIPLIRPLLGTWREEVLTYCREHALEPVIDLSNQDTTYYRNRLRLDLLPYLEQYNPRIRQVLLRTAQVMAGEHEVLDRSVESAWQECLVETGEDFVVIEWKAFLRQLPGLQRGMIRRAIAHLVPALRDIDFGDVERAMEFAAAPPFTRVIDLVAKVDLRLETNQLIFARRTGILPDRGWPQMSPGTFIPLHIPGECLLGDRWKLQASLHTGNDPLEEAVYRGLGPFETWLDASTLEDHLEIRTRLPGDRFQPLGLDGHSMKLADFMVNVKLPQRARKRWPLVCSGGEIAWVPGYRPAHPFRVTDSTQAVVYLKMSRLPGKNVGGNLKPGQSPTGAASS